MFSKIVSLLYSEGFKHFSRVEKSCLNFVRLLDWAAPFQLELLLFISIHLSLRRFSFVGPKQKVHVF
jgi:hypothetical protein